MTSDSDHGGSADRGGRVSSSLGAADTDRLSIEVWSDVVCPFCYLGDGLFTKALDRFPHRNAVDVRYRSFQLMPDLPSNRTFDLKGLLVERRGFAPEHIDAMHTQIAAKGADIGLDYRFDHALPTNTKSAHRLGHFAKQSGRQHDMIKRLFRAYFTDGRNIGDYEVLADLAHDIGLDRAEARAALDSGAFADDVDADIAIARELGITGVPFFAFNGTYTVSGAQPVEAYAEPLEMAWNDQSTATTGR